MAARPDDARAHDDRDAASSGAIRITPAPGTEPPETADYTAIAGQLATLSAAIERGDHDALITAETLRLLLAAVARLHTAADQLAQPRTSTPAR